MKKVFLIIGIILIVLIGAAIALPVIFRDQIIMRVKNEANKNLTARLNFGEFSVTILRSFPDFTLDLNDFSLSGTGDFLGDTLISSKDIHLTFDLMSVIKGQQYEIRTIRLNEPRIYARVLADGRANWDITIPDSVQKDKTPTSFKASLKEYEIKDGIVIYNDALLNLKAQLIGLNHKGSGDFTEENFTLRTNTDIASLTYSDGPLTYLSKVKTVLKADFDVDMKTSKYTFKENELQLNELLVGFDGWMAMPTDDIDMDIKFAAKKTDFKNLLSLVPAVYAKDFSKVKTAGKIALDGYAKGKYTVTTLPGFGVKMLIENAMFQYPDLPAAVKNIQANIDIKNPDGVPDHTAIDIKRFYMEMAGNPIDIVMQVRTPVSDPYVNGRVNGKVNLGSIKDVIPLEKGESLSGTIIANINMKGNVSALEKGQYDNFIMGGQLIAMDMDYKSKDEPEYDMMIKKAYMNFSPRFVELTAFESQMGKSDINATGRIENLLQYVFKDELLTGNFNMRSNLLDLNQFMTEEDPNATASAVPMTVFEVPANINFNLASSINKMLYENVVLTNAVGNIKIADQVITLENFKSNLLGGAMVVRGTYNTKNIKKPAIDFDFEVNNFDIQQTVKYLESVQTVSPIAKYAYGNFSTKFTMNGLLDEKMEPVYSSLTGLGKLFAEGVTIKDFKPFVKIAEVTGLAEIANFSTSEINPSFEFENGRLVVKPFDMKIGNITSTIQGSNGFDQTIDYLWKMDIPKKAMGNKVSGALQNVITEANKKGTDLSKLEKIPVQIKITGTTMDPKIRLDWKDLASNLAGEIKDDIKGQLKDKKDEYEDKAKAKADSMRQVAEDKVRAKTDSIRQEAEDKVKARTDSIRKAAEDKARQEVKDKLKGIFKK